MDDKFDKIAVLTSGGDAPGMNAAIRAVVRAGRNAGLQVWGVNRGYEGLMKGDFIELSTRDVSEIISLGGTILKTARSVDFMEEEGRTKAKNMLEVYGIDALVVIGGDGSLKGANELSKLGFPVVGIPATIDNDVASTEYTIGFDTSVNTAVDAIDKIRDTSFSHERCSVIEVMGREAGWIAYNVGLAVGAEVILLPEVPYDINEDILKIILEGRNRGKHHYIVVVAEGCDDPIELAKTIEKNTDIETRASVLGYIQRGGSPTAKDRTEASLMGMRAVDCILEGRFNRVVVEKNGKITDVDLAKAVKMKKSLTNDEVLKALRLF